MFYTTENERLNDRFSRTTVCFKTNKLTSLLYDTIYFFVGRKMIDSAENKVNNPTCAVHGNIVPRMFIT